jgi:hypothetical protein
MINTIIANIICLLHIIFIIFMAVAPFTKSPYLWILHIASSLSLLIHWTAGNDICFLTLTECFFRGVEKKESFIHRIVNPIYSIDDKDLSALCYKAVAVLMIISILKLVNHSKFKKLIKETGNSKELLANFTDLLASSE